MFKKLKSFFIITLTMLPATALAEPLIDDAAGDPIDSAGQVLEYIIRFQNIALAAAGAIAVAMIIWGGITIGTAGGNEERLGKGKKILTYAIGGLLLILFAGVVINLFIRILGGNVG